MNTRLALTTLLLLLTPLAIANSPEEPVAEEASETEAYIAWAKGIWDSLERRTGAIELKGANATLHVPENFYYLSPQDAETVLVEVWDNPPGQTTLGMLFPADVTPFEESSWAVTIDFEEDGYVSDADADKIDYNQLLKQMQADTRNSSKQRVKQGYHSIELVGWAAEPYYDRQAHKLHWAKELKFGDLENHTLNYNIRVLGRKGVLVLNFVADMDQKPIIEENLDTVLAMAEFNTGARYTDFNPDMDKVAAYGIGALVAGKVLTKTGFLAIALVFLKKFGIYILLAIGALFKGIFGRRRS